VERRGGWQKPPNGIGLPSTTQSGIEEQLKQIEAFAKEVPVRGLRWTFIHMEQATPNQIDRMKKLGMYIGVNPRGVISGAAFVRRFGERGYAMPNLKAMQDSGILWGFGTDAFEVNQYRPFTTLYYAVTGRWRQGRQQVPITRDALIAPRSNTCENDLGRFGRPADLVVITT
jgi:predicted amidohydrolase YtcJ